MTIEELLKRYNGGIFRGAKKRLADELKKTEGAVSRWLNGKTPMGEETERDVAKALNVSVDQLRSALGRYKVSGEMMVREERVGYGSGVAEELSQIRQQMRQLEKRLGALERERRPLR